MTSFELTRAGGCGGPPSGGLCSLSLEANRLSLGSARPLKLATLFGRSQSPQVCANEPAKLGATICGPTWKPQTFALVARQTYYDFSSRAGRLEFVGWRRARALHAPCWPARPANLNNVNWTPPRLPRHIRAFAHASRRPGALLGSRAADES